MDYEKLGSFYLGKAYDTSSGKLLDSMTMYDSRDLTTHAVCVGMTGSGKTGLCIGMLEEAAMDGVPAIIIDPKGDMSNLLLTFPELQTGDFRPWINVDDARRSGMTEDAFAAGQAKLWKKGLSDWGQDGGRIRRLRQAADFAVYTPGSSAGLPVSIISSFTPPVVDWDKESELAQERIGATVGALLGLIGIDADPLRSREHILLSSIFDHYWRAGSEFDLPALIMSIQDPPVRRLGVFDIGTFFPKKDRVDLAMALNGLVAAPGFQGWLRGQPLDIPSFLSSPDGRCRHSIFHIAHLSDPERMFFVTLLLNEVISWMRKQPGTTSLRALLYMDEIFGFFPPTANPPSKKPLLTILKQARAYGLGAVLTTQNPVDLDYKGLSNAGTWFIGRLQTERDRDRLLDGLRAASASSGGKDLGKVISSLGKRVFLLHNVHDREPVTFQTRWVMSYLRGPLTRTQIGSLMAGRKADGIVRPGDTPSSVPAAGPAAPSVDPAALVRSAALTPPQPPPGVDQAFLPLRVSQAAAGLSLQRGVADIVDGRLLYRPAVLGRGTVHFVNRKRKVNEEKIFCFLAPPPSPGGNLDWENAREIDAAGNASSAPEPGATFESLPSSANDARDFRALRKNLKDHLYRSSSIALLYCPAVKLYSLPFEEEREFRLRLQHELREKRDREIDKVERRYATKIRRISDRLEKANESLEKKKAVSTSRKGEVLVSVGESLLGIFMGRRSMRTASSTMSKYRMSRTAAMSIKEAEKTIKALQGEMSSLEKELKTGTDEVVRDLEESFEKLERFPVTPRRADIEVDFFGLAWVPYWRLSFRGPGGQVASEDVPAG